MGAHPFGEFDASLGDLLFDITDVVDEKGDLFLEGDDEGPPGVGVVEVKFNIFQNVSLFRIVSVADGVEEARLFAVRQHDHATVEIEAFLQGFHDEGEQLIDVEDHGGGLSDLLNEKGVIVADIDLVEKPAGRISLIANFGESILSFQDVRYRMTSPSL